MKHGIFFQLLFLIFPLFPALLDAQERPLNTGLSPDEQYAFIGMTLEELVDRFGPPRTVAAVRGIEPWQDDVVFQYTGVDFYIHINRVWQVQFATTHGISHGNRKTAVMLILGNIASEGAAAEDKGDHALVPVANRDWPLMIRINFNNEENTGQVTAIFLYRPDF